MSSPGPVSRIDRLMESASRSLEETSYWKAERSAHQALELARQGGDWQTMARICLPLQEARRQIAQLSMDAPGRFVISRGEDVPEVLEPGLYLVQPPLTGMDARMIRDALREREIPALVLAREPLTRNNAWPVVAVGRVIVRARVSPPEGVERDVESMTRDGFGSDDARRDGFDAWFSSACEAVGDRAIAECSPLRNDERIDALMDRLEAMSDHEKLHQALMETCQEAARARVTSAPRAGASMVESYE